MLSLRLVRLPPDHVRSTTHTAFVNNKLRYRHFGINRKPICDLLLVIITNLPPILHRFQVMADYMSNFR